MLVSFKDGGTSKLFNPSIMVILLVKATITWESLPLKCHTTVHKEIDTYNEKKLQKSN